MENSDWIALVALILSIIALFFTYLQSKEAKRANRIVRRQLSVEKRPWFYNSKTQFKNPLEDDKSQIYTFKNEGKGIAFGVRCTCVQDGKMLPLQEEIMNKRVDIGRGEGY